MTISVVAGRDVIKSDREEVADFLRRTLARVESGELQPNRAMIVLVDADVSSFSMTTLYWGRAVEVLGYIALAEDSLKQDIYE